MTKEVDIFVPPGKAAAATPSLRSTEVIAPKAFAELRRRMVLDFCKWDPQVGDVATLAPFALVMLRETWRELSTAAEAMASETLQLEGTLLRRPGLHRQLGLPASLRRLFRSGRPPTPAAARVMRFDFHLTADGWQVSEVNSDVPGGFTEASAYSMMMAEHLGETITGDPAAAYADALAAQGQHFVLLAAAGFMEDQQVVANLARLLESRGCRATLAQPQQLHWKNGRATFAGSAVHAIIRFYQAEWLASLPRRSGWHHLFVGGDTPVANPGIAALTESKRLPLLWRELGATLRAWPRYLPETCDPRDAPWRSDDRWLVKTAYCNTGDSVTLRENITRRRWLRTKLDILLHPRQWVAQRRFDTLPVETPIGVRFPCIGVYVIDGSAAGIYGRLSAGPVVDYAAMDVAVLLEEESR